jgi:hypothetical protein
MKKYYVHRGNQHTFNNLNNQIRRQANNLNNILLPTNNSRGGVDPNYLFGVLNKNPIRYVITNNTSNLYGVAVGRNLKNGVTRYINVFATQQGLGKFFMKKIKRNAEKNGKSYINLSSVPKVVGFYEKQGFVKKGTPNHGLVPMRFSFRPFLIKIPNPSLKVKLTTPAGLLRLRKRTRRVAR